MKKINKMALPALLCASLVLSSCAPPVATGEVQEHNVLHWEIVREVGCESEGYRFGLCIDCKSEVRDVMEPLGHYWRGGACVRCGAEDPSKGESEGIQSLEFELDEEENGYVITKCGEYTGKILVIPSEYNGKPVYKISDGVFAENGHIEELVISDSVRYIGNGAFRACTGLKKITFGKNVASIGGGAFEGCTGISEITLPDALKSFGSFCFRGCENLETVRAFGVEKIGTDAFRNCTSLYEFYFPHTLKTIGEYAFHNTSLAEANMPEGVTTVGAHAFSCSSVRSAVIPASLEKVGACIFEGCSELRSATVKSDKIVNEFENCAKLEFLEFSADVKSLHRRSLCYCATVTTVFLSRETETLDGALMMFPSLTFISYTGTSSEFAAIDGGEHLLSLPFSAVIVCSDKNTTCGELLRSPGSGQ